MLDHKQQYLQLSEKIREKITAIKKLHIHGFWELKLEQVVGKTLYFNLLPFCIFFKKTDFKFTANLSGRHRDFLYTSFPHYLEVECSHETLSNLKCPKATKQLPQDTYSLGMHKVNPDKIHMFTDIVQSCDGLMLTCKVVPREGNWRCHFCCSRYQLPLYHLTTV